MAEPFVVANAVAEFEQGGGPMLTCEHSEACSSVMRVMKDSQKSKRGSAASSVDANYSPDGRCCVLCGARKANDTDPVEPSQYMAWYYKHRQGRAQGSCCWYCGRSWYSRYRARHPTLGGFITACGEDFELLEQLRGTSAWLLEQCAKAGSRSISIAFSDLPQSVESTRRSGTSIEEEDQHIELQYYIHTWHGGMGDPNTNGKGHQTGWCEGVFGVFVPGPPIKRIKRKKEQFVDHKQVHHRLWASKMGLGWGTPRTNTMRHQTVGARLQTMTDHSSTHTCIHTHGHT